MIKKMLVTLGAVLLALWFAWQTLPRWLAALVELTLPPGMSLAIKSVPGWRHGLHTEGLRLAVADCTLLDVDDMVVSRADGRWQIDLAQLTLNSDCLAQLTPQTATEAAPRLAAWQQRLIAAEMNIAHLEVLPWQTYAGRAQLRVDQQQQQLVFRGDNLTLEARVQGNRWHLEQAEIAAPDVQTRLMLQGEGELAAELTRLPLRGALRGQMESQRTPDPLSVVLTWQGAEGQLQLDAPHENTPLVVLPWRITPDRIRIENGHWRWPYAAQPVSGQVAMTLQQWQQGLDHTRIDARLNMLTQGHNGRANAVLVLGPGQLGLVDSALRFQLTGQANLANLSVSASVPGEIRGSALSPRVAVLPGALLRAWGSLAPQLQLEEARWPLAGLRIDANGINGRLQAIVKANDRYWGRFAVHLDGLAQDFWPDQGQWQWRYWGTGHLPPLGAQWDVSGRGRWQDTLIRVEQLSSGLDQLRYGRVTAHQPRLTLTSPLQWQRAAGQEAFTASLQMSAQRVDLGAGGYLPASQWSFSVTGRSPNDFQWQGELRADAVGPVSLRGRWDGERLRGMGWWPTQPLTVFQPLLPPTLKIALRAGEFYTQVAFSAARKQGFTAGGHWVVKNGGAWLQDGEVRGVNFVLPYRLQQHQWRLGIKQPVALRIDKLVSVFDMQDIRLDLQGYYPFNEHQPLVLSQAEMGILRGKLSLSALRWPLRDPVVFTGQGLDLSELITTLKIKQFALSGRVSGVFPLDFNNPDQLISRGWLRNDGFLTLRIDQQLADEMAKSSRVHGAVMNWLRYLEISRAYASFDMTPAGELDLLSQVEGKNSQLSRQKPVILNYHHHQDLQQLWRSLRFGGNVQDTLEQRANENQP